MNRHRASAIETEPQVNPNFGKLVRVTLIWEREK
jgi:hypothetical protein